MKRFQHLDKWNVQKMNILKKTFPYESFQDNNTHGYGSEWVSTNSWYLSVNNEDNENVQDTEEQTSLDNSVSEFQNMVEDSPLKNTPELSQVEKSTDTDNLVMDAHLHKFTGNTENIEQNQHLELTPPAYPVFQVFLRKSTNLKIRISIFLHHTNVGYVDMVLCMTYSGRILFSQGSNTLLIT